jgi:hypothetical protein
VLNAIELAELIDNSAGVLSPEDNLENPQHFSVFNIKAILKQLTRLHIAIRKAGTQLRHHKADANLKYVLEHDNNGLGEFRGDMTKEIMAGLKEFRDDMTEEIMAGLECWDRKKGLPKPWENANRKLVERFVNANIRRRNRIFFATEKKREKKDRQVGVIKAPEPTGGKVEGPKEREKKPEGTSKTGESESTMEPPVDPLARQGRFNEESQEPTATSTIPLHAVIEQAPSKVAGTTITKATGIAQNQDYPSRPKWPESSTVPHIDCPYCSEPLTEEYTKNQMAWK